jgi:hypothetical protein
MAPKDVKKHLKVDHKVCKGSVDLEWRYGLVGHFVGSLNSCNE